MIFRLLIDADVYDVLLKYPAAKRNRLYAYFRQIQKYPGFYSEKVEPDIRGTMLDICTFENVVIRYWIDHADQHVKILELVPND